jgi:hypothetical protein
MFVYSSQVSSGSSHAHSGVQKVTTENEVFQKELCNGIPNVTLWRVLRKRLHFKAYKLSIVQHLERVLSVMKTFTPKDVQTIHRSTP